MVLQTDQMYPSMYCYKQFIRLMEKRKMSKVWDTILMIQAVRENDQSCFFVKTVKFDSFTYDKMFMNRALRLAKISAQQLAETDEGFI